MGGKKRKTHEEFVSQVLELTNGNYSVLGEYVNIKTKILLKHKQCGHEFKMVPGNFLMGQRCPNCRQKVITKKNTKTREEFVSEVFVKAGNEYSVLGQYINNRTKILLRHNECGREYAVTPGSFLLGCRCPHCSGKMTKTTAQFRKEVYELTNNEYVVLGNYVNSHTKTLMKHNCGDEFEMIPTNFLRGKRCPYCNSSNGEKRITQWLKENDISFKQQYSFENLRDKRLLRFDFAIFDNENITCLIEYDGAFHFRKFYDDDLFELTEYHDKLKDNYCKSNGIQLVRIPYWKDNEIEAILKRELAQQPIEAVF